MHMTTATTAARTRTRWTRVRTARGAHRGAENGGEDNHEETTTTTRTRTKATRAKMRTTRGRMKGRPVTCRGWASEISRTYEPRGSVRGGPLFVYPTTANVGTLYKRDSAFNGAKLQRQ